MSLSTQDHQSVPLGGPEDILGRTNMSKTLGLDPKLPRQFYLLQKVLEGTENVLLEANKDTLLDRMPLTSLPPPLCRMELA